jgi:hypothetical protein
LGEKRRTEGEGGGEEEGSPSTKERGSEGGRRKEEGGRRKEEGGSRGKEGRLTFSSREQFFARMWRFIFYSRGGKSGFRFRNPNVKEIRTFRVHKNFIKIITSFSGTPNFTPGGIFDDFFFCGPGFFPNWWLPQKW